MPSGALPLRNLPPCAAQRWTPCCATLVCLALPMPGEHVPPWLRAAVMAQASECCEYCRSQARSSPDSRSVEHSVPRSRGGRTPLGNLALSCQVDGNAHYARLTATVC